MARGWLPRAGAGCCGGGALPAPRASTSPGCSAPTPPTRPRAGSARALAVHPGGAVLASAGLDRYLRLNATGSRQLRAKVYLKTLPTSEC